MRKRSWFRVHHIGQTLFLDDSWSSLVGGGEGEGGDRRVKLVDPQYE
jgi:hypothetical protein